MRRLWMPGHVFRLAAMTRLDIMLWLPRESQAWEKLLMWLKALHRGKCVGLATPDFDGNVAHACHSFYLVGQMRH